MDIHRGTLPTVHMENRLKDIMECSPYLKDKKELGQNLLREEIELYLWTICDDIGVMAFECFLIAFSGAITKVKDGIPEVIATYNNFRELGQKMVKNGDSVGKTEKRKDAVDGDGE